MKKLILIGGGENGRGNKPYETKEIDEEIVKMTNKKNPVFLFIGLASNFSDSYYDIMKVIYKNLGCQTTYLKKKNIINNPDIVKNKIAQADIIYMCGGDTTKLVNSLKEYGIDELLIEAVDRGCVLTGISAGAIAITNDGLSDYLILNNLSDKYAFTNGLGIANISICPHANDKKRKDDLKNLLKNSDKKVFTLENGTALKIEEENISIIKSIPNAMVHLSYWKDGKWTEENITNFKI